MRRRSWLLVVPSFAAVTLLSTASCMRGTATAEGAPIRPAPFGVTTPTLVVAITVDQLRGDMLDRYDAVLQHGYRRLMGGGAWFRNAYHDHAITETAPGHASVLSGRFPRSTGIASNVAGVVDPNYRLLVGLPSELGASPFRFQGSALFDWIRATHPAARALSVSRKDRGAILTVGRAKEHVYWYSATGAFTTSNYYRDTLPDWVTAFNGRRIPHRYAGRQWTLARDVALYPEPDTVAEENGGRTFFPHQLPEDTGRVTALLPAVPSSDSVTALFALEGVRRLGLGEGPHPDLLAVSFSATDAVGHAFGPDSREARDNAIRLDQTLGWFLDSLFTLRPPANVLVVLTADHGVQPIPELARRRGEATGDQGLIVSIRPVVSEFRAALQAAGVDSAALGHDAEVITLAREPVGRAGLNADSIVSAFRAAALKVRGVARVDRLRDIRRADFALDPIARRWAHQMPEHSPADLVITLTRFSYWYPATATHGSPYDLDAHVPIIFYGPWFRPGRYTEFTRTVDIAPTLAAILGLQPSERLDGVVLAKAIAR